MKSSIAWWCFDEIGMASDQLFRAAREIGYTGIELAPVELWPAIRDHGLEIVADRGHGSIAHGLNDRSEHERCERELRAGLERAAQWSIPVLICFSGERHGLDDEAGAVNTATALRRVAREAENAGVLLALELLNSKIDHPGYQCDRTAWGVKVIEWVDSPAVKLLYDIYHMQVMEGDIVRTIRNNHQHFGHYHLAGNPGRNEPDATQELNYHAILRAIAETGYTGYLGMEFLPVKEPVASLQEGFDLVSDSLQYRPLR
ncbi:MAG: hydroxypyruvate isomerase family protein [Thermomicrobiales bacterium]